MPAKVKPTFDLSRASSVIPELLEHYASADDRGLAFYQMNPIAVMGRVARGELRPYRCGGHPCLAVIRENRMDGKRGVYVLSRPGMTSQEFVGVVRQLLREGFQVLDVPPKFRDYYGAKKVTLGFPECLGHTQNLFDMVPSRDRSYLRKCDSLLELLPVGAAEVPLALTVHNLWFADAKKRYRFVTGRALHGDVLTHWPEFVKVIPEVFKPTAFVAVLKETRVPVVVSLAVRMTTGVWANVVRRCTKDAPNQTALWSWQKAAAIFREVPLCNDGIAGGSAGLAQYKAKVGFSGQFPSLLLEGTV